MVNSGLRELPEPEHFFYLHRYSQYTVTLAYHVIAAWFVRSRVAYRKAFVGFVSKVRERLDARAHLEVAVHMKCHFN